MDQQLSVPLETLGQIPRSNFVAVSGDERELNLICFLKKGVEQGACKDIKLS